MIYTKTPRAYVTGGACASRQPATDACGDDVELWAPIWYCGGPIDAPEWMPTGRRVASHGHVFTELAARDD